MIRYLRGDRHCELGSKFLSGQHTLFSDSLRELERFLHDNYGITKNQISRKTLVPFVRVSDESLERAKMLGVKEGTVSEFSRISLRKANLIPDRQQTLW